MQEPMGEEKAESKQGNVSVGEGAPSFEARIEQLFESIAKKNFYFDFMKQITIDGPGAVGDTISMEMFKRGADQLVPVCCEVDIRVREFYMPVLRHMFMGVPNEQEAMRYVYNMEFFQKAAPNLRDYYEDFDEDVYRIVHSVDESKSEEEKRKLARQLSFLMMIAPKAAIRHILVHCFKNESLIQPVSEFLVRVPAFFELRVLKPHFQAIERELLPFQLFRRLLANDDSYISMREKPNQEILRKLMTAFTATNYREALGIFQRTPKGRALIDATEFISHFIMDHLKRGEYIDFLLGVLRDMFSADLITEWIIDWKSLDSDAANSQLNVELLSLLADLFVNKADKDETRNTISATLEKLALCLKKAKIMLPNFEFLQDKLAGADWCMKYCLQKWMSPCVEDYVLEVPPLLYDVLSSAQREKVIRLESAVKDTPGEEDMLIPVFQLGMVSPREALKFVDPHAMFKVSTEVTLMLAKALLHSIRSSTSSGTMSKLKHLLNQFCNHLDVPKKDFFVSKWAEKTYKGILDISYIQIFAEAVQLQIRDLSKGGDVKVALRSNGKLLLDSFCVSARRFLDTVKITEGNGEFNMSGEVRSIVSLNQLTIFAYYVNDFLAHLEEPPPELVSLCQRLHLTKRPFLIKLFGGEIVREEPEKKEPIKVTPVGEEKQMEVDAAIVEEPAAEKPKIDQKKSGKERRITILKKESSDVRSSDPDPNLKKSSVPTKGSKHAKKERSEIPQKRQSVAEPVAIAEKSKKS